MCSSDLVTLHLRSYSGSILAEANTVFPVFYVVIYFIFITGPKISLCPSILSINTLMNSRTEIHVALFAVIFFFSWRYTTHSGCVFYSLLSGFSLLAYEVI